MNSTTPKFNQSLIDDFKIVTSRHQLTLRPHREEDAEFMVELNSDPAITAYTPDGPLANVEVAKSIIQSLRQQFNEKRIGRFIVEDALTKKPIGWCGLKWLEDSNEIDLGYRFLKKTWGKGLATDAAFRCLEYGFTELCFPLITATVLPQNIGSIKVLEKIGMKKKGEVIEDGEMYLRFELTREEFKSKPIMTT